MELVMTSPRSTTWLGKFSAAGRGVVIAITGEQSFRVHLPAAVAVVVAGCYLRTTAAEWCVLLLCIAGVGTAELLNTAVERLAAAVDAEDNPKIRDALDIASGAVLWVSCFAAVIGGVVFASAWGRM